jgi:hypothetical protein
MTQPPTVAQLRNLTDRAAHGLTPDEIARLREGIDRLAEYENTINWMTTCTGCARVLDSCIRETERAEQAEAEVKRLRADIAACRDQQWPQRLGQAEKALNRVRRLAEFTRDHAAPAQDDMALAQHELACAVLDVLTEPKEPTP